MSTLLLICDEALGGVTNQWQLEVASEQLTVRELIRCRIYQEVQDVNLARRNKHLWLMQHAGVITDSLDARSASTTIDWRLHFERTAEAYEAGKFLILIGNRQTESLDEEIELTQGTLVTFLKLIPLVGG